MDFIKVYDNVVPLDVCERLISKFEEYVLDTSKRDVPIVEPASIGVTSEKDASIRSNQVIHCRYKDDHDLDSDFNHLIWEELFPIITSKIDDYDKEFEDALTYLGKWRTWQVDFLKYEKGTGFYKEHVDSDDGYNHRILSLVIYLNDVDSGGETTFRWQDKKVKPKAGRVVLFPSTWNFPHQAEIPLSDDKYSFSVWVEPANDWFLEEKYGKRK